MIRRGPHAFVIVAVAAGFVLLGHLLVAPRDVHLGYDASFYVRMVEGPMVAVPEPFRGRILVPWLARQLPMPPAAALQLISYLSLFGCYSIVMASCVAIGLRVRESIFGVAAVWGSTWHLYYYWNPYMTDAFGLLMLAIMMWAVLTERLWPFATASLLGVLAREGTAMLVPAWFVTRQWWTTIALCAGTLVMARLPHVWMNVTPDPTIAIPAFEGQRLLINPVLLVRQLHAIWGMAGILGVIGGTQLSSPHSRRIGAVTLALLVGTIAASAFATDTGRMFGFLAPVLAVACAQLYAVLRQTSVVLTIVTSAAIAVQWVFNAPDVVIEPSSAFAGWPRRAFVVAQLILGLVIAVRVRRRPHQLSTEPNNLSPPRKSSAVL